MVNTIATPGNHSGTEAVRRQLESTQFQRDTRLRVSTTVDSQNATMPLSTLGEGLSATSRSRVVLLGHFSGPALCRQEKDTRPDGDSCSAAHTAGEEHGLPRPSLPGSGLIQEHEMDLSRTVHAYCELQFDVPSAAGASDKRYTTGERLL